MGIDLLFSLINYVCVTFSYITSFPKLIELIVDVQELRIKLFSVASSRSIVLSNAFCERNIVLKSLTKVRTNHAAKFDCYMLRERGNDSPRS